MIGKSKPTIQVSDKRREKLKRKIDRVGRTKYASYIGEGYYNLSAKLNGNARLSEVYYCYYETKLKELTK